MADRTFGFDTLSLHAGQIPDAATGSRAVPIYQTSAYVFDSPEHAASLFNLQTFGNVYSRLSNPTVAVFEERIASLEGGRAAVATGSGMSAQMISLLNVCEAGDQIVAARTLYGGTHTQLSVNVARIGQQAGVPLFVDNTFASPYLCRPFEWGAAITLHSATKFIGGHGTTMGGVIIESGKFPWDNGRFPSMTEPSPGYHGVRFFETFGDFGFTMKCRMEGMRTFGPALSPFNAFLLLQGVETLSLRMDRHCSSALAVAQYLEKHPKVAWVNYPSLPNHPDHALAKKYMPKGAGAVLSFGVKGGTAAGQKFIEHVSFLSHLANIGDAKTLVIHPASTTHRQLSEAQQIAAGVPPDLIRLSVGLETLDDIVWDIDQALANT